MRGEDGKHEYLKDPAVAGKNKRPTSLPGRGTVTSPYGVTKKIVVSWVREPQLRMQLSCCTGNEQMKAGTASGRETKLTPAP